MSSVCEPADVIGQVSAAANAVTPGWNDPPPSGSITRSAGSNGLHQLQRQRRPVDPSIQCTANFVQFGGKGASSSNNAESGGALKPPQMAPNANFHQSRSFPQLAHAQQPPPLLSETGPDHQQQQCQRPLSIGTHPGSAFTPITPAGRAMSASHTVAHSQSQSSLLHMTSSAASMSALQQQQPQQQFGVAPNPGSRGPQAQQMSTTAAPLLFPPTAPMMMPMGGTSTTNLPQGNVMEMALKTMDQQHQQQQHHFYPPNNYQQQLPNPPADHNQNLLQQQQMTAQPPQPVLFSPPNTVPLLCDQSNNGHYLPSSLNGISPNATVPVKAAGDVSLNGQQLAAFLTKATHLLQQGPIREGIQLRINQFGDFVQAGQISEPCLKKLNFVVDAIDRHVYEEAWQFFEQMLATFPTDCATGGWAHGIRLLLQELRKTAGGVGVRAHSAGTRLVH